MTDLASFTRLEIVSKSQYKYSDMVPSGFVPDPPHYYLCAKHLAEGEHHRRSRRTLIARCQREQKAAMRSALSSLIDDVWIEEEAVRLGVKVSSGEVERETRSQGVKSQILHELAVPSSDQTRVIRVVLLLRGIFETLPAYLRAQHTRQETAQMAAEVDQENTDFFAAMKHRWTGRTECRTDFVVPGCNSSS